MRNPGSPATTPTPQGSSHSIPTYSCFICLGSRNSTPTKHTLCLVPTARASWQQAWGFEKGTLHLQRNLRGLPQPLHLLLAGWDKAGLGVGVGVAP